MDSTYPLTPLPGDNAAVYLILAGMCLLVALRFARRATAAPVGKIIEVTVTAAVVAFAMGMAFVLVVAAAFSR